MLKNKMEKDTKTTKEKKTKDDRAERRRNDRRAREKDRERKRAKRLNPAYRMMEQERDRERKKILRSNEAFRNLEKTRDRMRKERKRFCSEWSVTAANFRDVINIDETLDEPEIVLTASDCHPQNEQQNPCNNRNLPQDESPSGSHF